MVTGMSPRRYEQQLRAESAAQTRRRILDAAHDRLRTSPVERVTVERVARDAGVSRATIYLVFGDRTGLFDAIGADLLERSGFEEVMRAVEEPDSALALDRFVHASTQMYAHNQDVMRSLFAMARIDPSALGGAITRMENGRNHGMRQLAERLHDSQLLRPDTSVDEAADLLWVLSSFDSYDQLHVGRRRTTTQVAHILLTTIRRSLLR